MAHDSFDDYIRKNSSPTPAPKTGEVTRIERAILGEYKPRSHSRPLMRLRWALTLVALSGLVFLIKVPKKPVALDPESESYVLDIFQEWDPSEDAMDSMNDLSFLDNN